MLSGRNLQFCHDLDWPSHCCSPIPPVIDEASSAEESDLGEAWHPRSSQAPLLCETT